MAPWVPDDWGAAPGWAKLSLGLSVGLTRKGPQEPRPTALLELTALRVTELSHQGLLLAWAPEMPLPSVLLPKAIEVWGDAEYIRERSTLYLEPCSRSFEVSPSTDVAV